MMSPESARRAESLGYVNVKVFHTGMPSWKKKKNVVLTEAPHLQKFIKNDIAHVLIDLRDAENAQQGFIKGAVSVPEKELATLKGMFPADKSAPVILYGNATASTDTFATVRGWGYKNTSILSGGISAWQQSGGELHSGKLSATIAYIPKPRPGEIQIADFKKIADKTPPEKLILDVRDEEESMQGMLVGAVNIPVDELKNRLGELPEDKEIIIYCVTGIRAEMAYDILKENGLNTRFLNSVIQIDSDGRYEVTRK